ncbi:hypothetical protein YTPLAS72_01910 [Nitrospira sp.]|nr:hypothetical protein YTPLAS72_01910 [Nitrospira sp.]
MRGSGSKASETPRPETPCRVESSTVVPRSAVDRAERRAIRPLGGVARPWQPRVATHWEILLRPPRG